jgi:hypothetical protein
VVLLMTKEHGIGTWCWRPGFVLLPACEGVARWLVNVLCCLQPASGTRTKSTGARQAGVLLAMCIRAPAAGCCLIAFNLLLLDAADALQRQGAGPSAVPDIISHHGDGAADKAGAARGAVGRGAKEAVNSFAQLNRGRTPTGKGVTDCFAKQCCCQLTAGS